MRVAIFCAAVVFAATGAAVAKEKKKVAVSDAAALCAANPSAKKPVPNLDRSFTGTAKSEDSGAKPEPRLGYDTNPWIVTGF
ncbi:hypothetical protein [Mesorhizobium cantuariense]|uniref:DUF680 domain-containing protein n=1 Tax=Mesorhizobium cantuariense TaxID=1300275 RepID=A0ABV7MQL6_9HYPH